jgi:hypothetical protein
MHHPFDAPAEVFKDHFGIGIEVARWLTSCHEAQPAAGADSPQGGAP